jgi:hypothetical protein
MISGRYQYLTDLNAVFKFIMAFGASKQISLKHRAKTGLLIKLGYNRLSIPKGSLEEILNDQVVDYEGI